jgi:chemotaxis signal transduction protein
VVDLHALFAEPAVRPQRMVTLKIDDRLVAAVVESVVGVHSIGRDRLNRLPPLLQDAAGEVVSAVGTLDSELLLFLHSARIAPVDLLADTAGEGAGS